MELHQARPPYVSFEQKAEEDRSNYLEGAPPKFKDVDFAYITPIGSKERVERKVSEWFPQLRDQVRQGRFEQQWLSAYEAAYEAWKKDQEPPVNGTSIKSWPVLTVGQVKTLTNLRILAVEDLANANEETISRIGMGGRGLKLQAIEWLRSQEKGGLATLVKTVEAMRLEVEALKSRNAELEAANKAAKAEKA